MFRFVKKVHVYDMGEILRFKKPPALYSIVQQQCLLAAQLHYLQAYLTASSQHQQQQQFTSAVGSLSQHVERGGKEFPSDGRVVLPPGGENQESPRSNVNAVSVPYNLLSLNLIRKIPSCCEGSGIPLCNY